MLNMSSNGDVQHLSPIIHASQQSSREHRDRGRHREVMRPEGPAIAGALGLPFISNLLPFLLKIFHFKRLFPFIFYRFPTDFLSFSCLFPSFSTCFARMPRRGGHRQEPQHQAGGPERMPKAQGEGQRPEAEAEGSPGP